MEATAEARERMERWFRNRGVPHLIKDYTPSDKFPLATTILQYFLGIELLMLLLRPQQTAMTNGVIVIGALAVFIFGGWLAKKLKGRSVEPRRSANLLMLLAIAPALLPLLYGQQLALAGAIASVNISIVAITQLSSSYAVGPITYWAARELPYQAIPLCLSVARAFPLVLVFATFLMLQNELWQIAAKLHGAFLWMALLTFPATGALFIVLWTLQRIESHVEFKKWEDVLQWVEELADDLKDSGDSKGVNDLHAFAASVKESDRPKDQPLNRGQKINLAFTMLFVLGLQITLVSVIVACFLLVFGRLTIAKSVADEWVGSVGSSIHLLWSESPFGSRLGLSKELVIVAGLLASFSGLYFTLQGVKDEAYYQDFLQNVDNRTRKALALRCMYLSLNWEDGDAGNRVKINELQAVEEAPMEVWIGTWNLENLFRPGSEFGPQRQEDYEAKLQTLAQTINAATPDVLAVQEVGEEEALADLVKLLDGAWNIELSQHFDKNHPIRVGFLSRHPMTATHDVFELPSPLRPPQAGDADGEVTTQMGRGALAVRVDLNRDPELILVTCHLKSKLLSFPGPSGTSRFDTNDEGERARWAAYALYRRTAEAVTVRGLADQLLDNDGKHRPIILLGDLNDEAQAATTQILLGPPGSQFDTRGFDRPDRGDAMRLWNLAPRIEERERYSRIFQGRPELIDHILISHALLGTFKEVRAIHGEGSASLPSVTSHPRSRRNSHASDHAPIVASFAL
jgi:endonuclease/exonuclease/phosphatase family metal-dependent hydrolase